MHDKSGLSHVAEPPKADLIKLAESAHYALDLFVGEAFCSTSRKVFADTGAGTASSKTIACALTSFQ
jgi:hypothetical protein